jgi:hypothetical protein
MAIYTPRASDVRINEIDLSQVVTSNSSSTAAQVIVSTQGSTDPRRWTNAQDYMGHYGIPNAAVSFDVYCGLDFFREGNDMWALRVVGPGALYSGVCLYADVNGVTHLNPTSAGVADPTQPDFDSLVPGGTDVPIALFYGNKGPGSYADNLAISITSQNLLAPASLSTASSVTNTGTLAAGTYNYQVASIGPNGETMPSPTSTIVIASGTGTPNTITLTWPQDPQAIGYAVYGRITGSGYGFITQVGQTNQSTVTFVDTGGVVPNATRLPITDPADLPAPVLDFIVNVFDLTQSANFPVEQFTCTLQDATDDNGVATELEERINPFSNYIQVKSNVPALPAPDTITIDSVAQKAMDGGDSGTAPTSFDIANAWSVFSNKELYGVNVLINGGHSDPTVQQAMDSLAQSRGDAVALLDVPSNSQQFQQAINYRNLTLNLNSSYSALFCPDMLESDNINGKQQYVPFSGWAAALCARTDRVANPSFSIAGLNRGLVNVLKTRFSYDDGEASAMFKAQVNYTRTFVGQGIALWEQQTMQAKASALSWLSVRRIVNVIKVSLYQFGLYVLQEPNDDFTRRQMVRSFSDYLDTLQNARALNSYSVIADASNNSAADANSGVLRCTVILIPVIPVHELQIDVVISKQGVSFQETVTQLYGG